MNRRIGVWLFVCVIGSSGCAAFRPLKGVAAHKLPDEYRCAHRTDQVTIDLSLLRQSSPPAHLVDSGDILGIYIEGLLGRDGDVPPIYLPHERFAAPSVGYPIAVQPDGTISVPSMRPFYVRGLTIRQVEELIRHECAEGPQALLQKGYDRILVSLQRPRIYSVLVIRQEADDPRGNVGIDEHRNSDPEKRGMGQNVLLPAYKNDVLHALAETGGLPGLDAQNTVYIVRGQRPNLPVSPPTASPPGVKVRGQTPSVWPASVPTAHTVAPLTRQFGPTPLGGWSPPPTNPYQSYRDSKQPPRATNQVIGNTPYGTTRPHSSTPVSAPSGPNVLTASHSVSSAIAQPPGFPPVSTYSSQSSPGLPMQSLAIASPYPVVPPQSVPMPPQLSWIAAGVVNPAVIRIPLRQFSGEPLGFSEQDVILQDGDIVFVEARDLEFFYTGGLLGGGQYTLPRDYDINVLDAISIAEAQGKNYWGNSLAVGGVSAINHDVTVGASKVIVSRKQPDGSQLDIEVDLYRAMRDPSHRIIIRPEDRLYLRYTRVQAVFALFERHLLEGFLIGAASTALY